MAQSHRPDHAHEHRHGHGHVHVHAPADFNSAFAIGIGLNIAFVILEAIVGWRINSLALLADAGHNLSDVAGLVLAWGGALAGRLRPDARHTYGWQRASILAAFANSLLLLVAMGSLAWEAVGRLGEPQTTEGWTIILVAGVGIVINTATALLFMRGRQHDLNIRGAFLHMAADALVSLAVLIGGLVYLWRGWGWIDPVMSLAIAAVIVVGTWHLFRQSLHLLFDGVPDDIDLGAVRQMLMDLPGVDDVHDLHVWAIGTARNALTAHLVLVKSAIEPDTVLREAGERLHRRFEISHVTLQLESAAVAASCTLRCDSGRA